MAKQNDAVAMPYCIRETPKRACGLYVGNRMVIRTYIHTCMTGMSSKRDAQTRRTIPDVGSVMPEVFLVRKGYTRCATDGGGRTYL